MGHHQPPHATLEPFENRDVVDYRWGRPGGPERPRGRTYNCYTVCDSRGFLISRHEGLALSLDLVLAHECGSDEPEGRDIGDGHDLAVYRDDFQVAILHYRPGLRRFATRIRPPEVRS